MAASASALVGDRLDVGHRDARHLVGEGNVNAAGLNTYVAGTGQFTSASTYWQRSAKRLRRAGNVSASLAQDTLSFMSV